MPAKRMEKFCEMTAWKERNNSTSQSADSMTSKTWPTPAWYYWVTDDNAVRHSATSRLALNGFIRTEASPSRLARTMQ
jgi:hypothetical protein